MAAPTCYATADQPPKYIQYEGSFIVGVKPPNPSQCVALSQTLDQLQQQNCSRQGLTWNGQQCVTKPWYQQTWFWLLVLFIVFVAVLVAATTRNRSAQTRFANFPMQ